MDDSTAPEYHPTKVRRLPGADQAQLEITFESTGAEPLTLRLNREAAASLRTMLLASSVSQRDGTAFELAMKPQRVTGFTAFQWGDDLAGLEMRIGELEGMAWQIRLFDSMTDEQQMDQLRETLHEIDRMPRTLAPMLTAWSAGDVNQLRRIVNASGGDSPAVHRMIYTNRNASWARWIRERMARPGTVFIAVGAAHLAGTDNVQSQLRRLGLRATRVPHVETAH